MASRHWRQRHSIAAQARHHRRIEGIGNTGVAEQIMAVLAETRATISPDRADPVDIGLGHAKRLEIFSYVLDIDVFGHEGGDHEGAVDYLAEAELFDKIELRTKDRGGRRDAV